MSHIKVNPATFSFACRYCDRNQGVQINIRAQAPEDSKWDGATINCCTECARQLARDIGIAIDQATGSSPPHPHYER